VGRYHRAPGPSAVRARQRPLIPIPQRPARAGPNQVDLSAAYNVVLNETWQPVVNLTNVDLSLAALSSGHQTYGGVGFDVRGLIQLRRGAPDGELYPEQMPIP
jgi:hypothetical protein